MPAAILSIATIIDKEVILFSDIATYEKQTFVSITKKAPNIRDLYMPIFFKSNAPIDIPNIDASNATILTTAPISVRVKPISI